MAGAAALDLSDLAQFRSRVVYHTKKQRHATSLRRRTRRTLEYLKGVYWFSALNMLRLSRRNSLLYLMCHDTTMYVRGF